MKVPKITDWSRLAPAAAAGLALMCAAGCQTNIGGQSLPSAYYLQDDVQYFPAGPEDKLFNERRALEQYKASREAPPVAETPPPAGAPAAPPPPQPQPPNP